MPKGTLIPENTAPTSTDYIFGYMAGPTTVRVQLQKLRAIFSVKRVASNVTATSITPNSATDDVITVNTLASNLTIAAASGTPGESQTLVIRIRDDGTARTITWNSAYRAIGVTAPTTTVAGKWLYIGLMYNAADTLWDIVSVNRQA